VVQQAIDRADNHIRDVEGYFRVRRDTIGAKPSFTLLEFTMNIPDEVMNHPIIQDLSTWCIDMLIIGNVSLLGTLQNTLIFMTFIFTGHLFL